VLLTDVNADDLRSIADVVLHGRLLLSVLLVGGNQEA
jgi:hypothetical protein